LTKRGTSGLTTAAWCLLLLALPQAGAAYSFGEDVQARGPEEIVFDHSDSTGALKDACTEDNVPDLPPRAFRRADGRVQLSMSHTTNRRMIGTSLDTLATDCRILLESGHDADPAAFDDNEWISATHTTDGTNVTAIVHNEYHGYEHDNCEVPAAERLSRCWSNSITLARSTDQGDTFTHAAPPAHLIATLPYRYSAVQSRNAGLFSPSNLIQKQPQPQADDHYYMFTETGVTDAMEQQYGVCLLRTRTPDDPASWRAWDGAGFNLRFFDPYANPSEPPAMHLCQPVSPWDSHFLSSQVTYNSYLGKYVLIDTSAKYRAQRETFNGTTEDMTPGVYYSTSSDLIHWSDRKLLMAAEVRASWRPGTDPDTGECLDDRFIAYPVLLDPGSSARNFETTGARPYLYFVRTNTTPQGGCAGTLDRDLVRVPVRFNKDPVARFESTPSPVVAGRQVTFDASQSSDADGPIAGYAWDLDGNGTFETDTGSSANVSTTYPISRIGTVNVGLRVTDGDGASTETGRLLTIEARVNFQPDAASLPAGYVKDAGLPYGPSRGYGWVRQDGVAADPHGAHAPLDMSANARDRDLAPDQQLDTLIHVQYPPASPRADVQKTPGAWEIDVPDGTYTVRVGAGDAGCAGETACTRQQVNVEGVTALVHEESPPDDVFAQKAATVPVTDGKLTIDAIGGDNTKLGYVQVAVYDRVPIASFLASPSPVTLGADVRLTAAGFDPDGAVTKYEWDLDGDGAYETDSGTATTVFSGGYAGGEVQYRTAQKVRIGIRATDDMGFHGAWTRELRVQAQFNFQPSSEVVSPQVPTFVKDPGVTFEPGRGHGWVTEQSVRDAPHDSASHTPLYMQPNSKDRNLVAPGHPCSMTGVDDQLMDNFVYMQYPPMATRTDIQKIPAAWELAVGRGSYRVFLGVGDAAAASDPQFRNSVHTVNVEGVRAIDNFVPTAANPCKLAVVAVDVTDGRLTVDAIGGTNTKLTYIEVRPL
jgi:PKD repeat protein